MPSQSAIRQRIRKLKAQNKKDHDNHLREAGVKQASTSCPECNRFWGREEGFDSALNQFRKKPKPEYV